MIGRKTASPCLRQRGVLQYFHFVADENIIYGVVGGFFRTETSERSGRTIMGRGRNAFGIGKTQIGFSFEQHAYGFIGRCRVEIACYDGGMISGDLHYLAEEQLGAFFPGFLTFVVEVGIKMEENLIGFFIAEPGPGHDPGNGGIPAFATGYCWSLREPEGLRGKHLKAGCIVEDSAVFSLGFTVVPAPAGVFVLWQTFLQIHHLVVKRFLYANGMRLVEKELARGHIFTEGPGVRTVRSCIQPDVESHYMKFLGKTPG